VEGGQRNERERSGRREPTHKNLSRTFHPKRMIADFVAEGRQKNFTAR
jgi:hypothetical protein